VTKKYKQIYKDDIVCLQKIGGVLSNLDCPYKFSFEIKTSKRIYQLYAPTAEERDLWVFGINRIMNVPVDDPSFTPLKMITGRDSETILNTEGNNNSQRQASASKINVVEESKH
jgi:hypothetical protein